MGDIVRFLGLISSGLAIGALIVLGTRPKGSTGFAAPWRYWGAAAGLLIEVGGVISRVTLWSHPLSWRDLNFLAINICIIVACIGTVTTGNIRQEA